MSKNAQSQVALGTPFDNQTNGFISTNVQDAIEEAKNTAQGKVRFSIQLSNNGTMTNNQRVGYSELLLNTPVILPRECILREITFSNQNTNTDARFDIYRRNTPAATNSPSGATLLQQWSLTNSLTGVLSGLNYSFSAGQEILIIFVDTGDNPSDATLVCFFEVA